MNNTIILHVPQRRISIFLFAALVVLTGLIWLARSTYYAAFRFEVWSIQFGDMATGKIVEAISLAAIGVVFLRGMMEGCYVQTHAAGV